jgi:hypothetical protein
MKWFFLFFIALMAVLVNIAAMTNAPLSKAAAIAAFNVALVGLLLIWYGSYFEVNVVNAKCRELGVSLLGIAAGVFIAQGGINAAFADSCDGFFSSRSYRLRDDVVRFFQSHGYCGELGYVVALAGIGLTYIGAKLLFRVNRGGH